MIVVVVGGKGADKRGLVNRSLDQIHHETPITKIVTGSGYGTETFAKQWAYAHNIPAEIYRIQPSERNTYQGKRGDHQRNARMVNEQHPDLALVFAGSSVADTMIDIARGRGITYKRVTAGGIENPARTFAREPAHGWNNICLVGDHVHPSDIIEGGPFLGEYCEVLERLTTEAGIDTNECLITSVFMEPADKSTMLSNFIKRNSAELRGIPINENMMPLIWNYQPYYLKVGYESEITRLQQELQHWQPRITVALGVCALWALTGVAEMGKYHGRFLLNELTGYGLVIPTFSLASLRYSHDRNWYVKNVLELAQKSAIIKRPEALFRRFDSGYELSGEL